MSTTLADLHQRIKPDQPVGAEFMAGAAAAVQAMQQAAGPFARDEVITDLQTEIKGFIAQNG